MYVEHRQQSIAFNVAQLEVDPWTNTVSVY